MLVFNWMSAQHLISTKPLQSGETINIFCDRALYGVSENIYFTAFYKQPSQVKHSPWSTVLYAELIRWDGTKLAQQKVRIKNGFADGCMTIPENMKSGNYYLRVYTRWMRNYSPYAYSNFPIKIINPYIAEIDEGPVSNEQDVQILKVQKSNISEDIVFAGIEKRYGTRQLVEFELSILDKQLSGPYCLSVAMSQNREEVTGSIDFSGYENDDSIKEIEFLPEIRGVSLSGKVIDRDTQQPLARESITLTSSLKPFYYSQIISNSSGDFIFSIPGYIGIHQFCIGAGNSSSNKVEFLINSDYCNQAISLPFVPFELTREEMRVAKEIISNTQLLNKYSRIRESAAIEEEYPPFYGKSQSTTYIKDYIELVDLKEFFFELIPDVYIKYNNRKPYLELIDMGGLTTSSPMVLLDNIPVGNDESLLSISPRNIERIEVINGGYIVGKNRYSGIISIYSNHGDLAGMELPENTKFFNYNLLSSKKFSFPDYSKNSNSRKADTRNLLYWSPYIELSDEAAQRISFYTSDAIGEYTVTLQGIDESGSSIVYGQSHFTVE
ncbi:TonB-dependent receptor plug domain-containing protein [Bacteroidota bacterium]